MWFPDESAIQGCIGRRGGPERGARRVGGWQSGSERLLSVANAMGEGRWERETAAESQAWPTEGV